MAAAGKALAAIQELIKRGISPNEVYRQTGMKQGIDGNWLDMSQQARMARAKEQGFGENVYRGLGSESQKADSGITWTTTDPKMASEYAQTRGWGEGEHVQPLMTAAKNPVRFRHAEQRKKISEMLSEVMEQSDNFKNEDLAKQQWDSLRKKYGDNPQEVNKFWQDPDVTEFIDNAGFDSIRAPEGGAQGVDTIGIIDQSKLRSTNAAFDPSAKDSANLLAGIGGLGVGIGAMGQSGETEAKDYGYGKRLDGSDKGRGYFGEISRPDGGFSTELSIGIDFGEGEMDIPLLTPNQSTRDIDALIAGEEPTREMIDRAVNHARSRIANKQSPFAGDQDNPTDYKAPPLGLGTIEAAKYPMMQQAADYIEKVEVPILGKPLQGLSDWARGAAYQDPGRLKRAAIGALDLI